MNQREIKFRGWNKESKIMVDEIELITLRETFKLNDAFSEEMIIIPLQFTGLKDKNGTEIYEGDIIKGILWKHNKEFIGYVWYRGFDFVARKDFDNDRWTSEEMDTGWEVIGNIYENPELLKE